MADEAQLDEPLRLLLEIHAATVRKTPAGDDLVRAAREVVRVRYQRGGDWKDLSYAIGALEVLVGRPTDEG